MSLVTSFLMTRPLQLLAEATHLKKVDWQYEKDRGRCHDDDGSVDTSDLRPQAVSS